MEYNKSLSARIRRRNKQGFSGEGNSKWIKTTPFSDYNNPMVNHKDKDYKLDNERKSKFGVTSNNSYKLDARGNIIALPTISKNRCFCKKYADNHQKA